ncbi:MULTISPECIES: efflux RND transporter permease subunit [unclassified Corallococcus]|uniref:efflux RND transporter permease subunit n=1 Tax=unclassified Corallococcus TaxID=2685029 RepID=UPI001A8F275E|nr:MULTISPECIES: MMPL family transporter [unclassified Corallococcus]MBN9682365.1 MMPL family transporter [Corallococcus sp. NCSPR001]WAS86083.1 MMPL family transporter [Corallococcus sp. NCRR]
MSGNPSSHPPPRLALAYAEMLVRRPGTVMTVLLLLLGLAVWGTSKLTINSNQLDLISQDLQEVKDVKRVIDMVGGSGFFMLTFRGDDEATLKKVADDVAAMVGKDKENARSVTYKIPVEFVQNNMVLFVKTEDLAEGKRRIMAFLKDQIRRANPFYIEIKKTEPVKLDLQDLVDKYSSVGNKSIADDYYISQDRKLLLLLIKPMWDTNQIGQTKQYVDKLRVDLEQYSKSNAAGVQLVEDYYKMGDKKTVAYGFTGSYKTAVDDSYAIEDSLQPVTIIALVAIFAITIAFFRKWAPTLIVVSGTVAGTLYTLGFTYATLGELNMITSILGGILMGFGIDYGIHFIFRTRLELGAGKRYDVAIRDAVINAGRPALVSAVVVAGSFYVLMVSEFKGFSQFGFLAGTGTLMLGFTLFSWCPAMLALAGRRNPELPQKLIGVMKPPPAVNASGKELRIPRPGLVLAVGCVIVAMVCGAAIPWKSGEPPADAGFFARLPYGVRFNYNTRALMPANQPSVVLQDEINARFKIASDPLAVYTKDLAETEALYKELTTDPKKRPAISQVMSLFTFVPPEGIAQANTKILEEWQEELKDIDVKALPPETQEKAALFFKMLEARPFDVHHVPEIYASQFRHLPTTSPENHGYLTFIYPSVDLWDGKQMLQFADQTSSIKGMVTPGKFTDAGPSGPPVEKEFRAAGATQLYASLARMVLKDAKLTVILTALWILVMHFADFRNAKLALASVIPLTVGLAMMMGFMALFDLRLNFMNIIILPILLGFGVSHGLYLLHRFLEGTSPLVALRSVGAAVASSTLTAVAGFAALLVASHNGLRSMGLVACIGLITTLLVSFTVLAAVMQLMHDQRQKDAGRSPEGGSASGGDTSSTRAA